MLLALSEGTPPVTGGLPSQRPVTWISDLFFDLHLNRRLGKQSRHRWFEKPWHSLWRHYNGFHQQHLQQNCFSLVLRFYRRNNKDAQDRSVNCMHIRPTNNQVCNNFVIPTVTMNLPRYQTSWQRDWYLILWIRIFNRNLVLSTSFLKMKACGL